MRRKKSGGVGLNLDSLMDTLTNVVGIMVMMLVVTQLDVRETVQRIYAALPDVNEEELEQARKEAEALRKLLKELNGGKVDPNLLAKRDETSLAEQKRLIAELRKALEELKKSKVDVASLKKEKEKEEAKVDKLETAITKASKEMANLKALLAKTPEAKQPPPVQITLPNPRTAPKGVSPVDFVCQGRRIRPMDVSVLRKIAVNEILNATRGKLAGGLECDKMVKHFEKKDVGNAFYRLKFQSIRGDPYVAIEPREKRGNNIEGMLAKNSLYIAQLRTINRQKYYLRFRVWSDSFDTYLVARAIADRGGFAAGWLPYDKSFVWRVRLNLPGGVRCKGAPPPPPPPKTKPKVRPPVPVID